MTKPNIDYHQDTALFGDALRFTAAKTGFSDRLIEKDYYCSVALADLCAPTVSEIVFKGGTCLSKIHADFFRLSEDLDFAISTAIDCTRSQRSQRLAGFKRHFAAIARRCDCFRITEALRGFNNSLQYGARLAYTSVVTGEEDYLKIEVSVREPIIESVKLLPAKTLLVDPFRGTDAVAPFATPVLTLREAYAEKLRAALSRREPAIRDFFDLDHAFSAGTLDVADAQLIQLLKAKLSIPGNGPVNISPEKLGLLRAQVAAQLRSVIREVELDRFDLDRAFERAAEFAHAVGE
jgi:predicted nucleotidyltransferase component of viral defense system